MVRPDSSISSAFKVVLHQRECSRVKGRGLPNFCQAAVSFKISNLLICFCSFDFSCPILKKDNFIEMLYKCLVLLIAIYLFFVANLVCFDFDTRFYKILNAIDDICERIFYHLFMLCFCWKLHQRIRRSMEKFMSCRGTRDMINIMKCTTGEYAIVQLFANDLVCMIPGTYCVCQISGDAHNPMI